MLSEAFQGQCYQNCLSVWILEAPSHFSSMVILNKLGLPFHCRGIYSVYINKPPFSSGVSKVQGQVELSRNTAHSATRQVFLRVEFSASNLQVSWLQIEAPLAWPLFGRNRRSCYFCLDVHIRTHICKYLPSVLVHRVHHTVLLFWSANGPTSLDR